MIFYFHETAVNMIITQCTFCMNVNSLYLLYLAFKSCKSNCKNMWM